MVHLTSVAGSGPIVDDDRAGHLELRHRDLRGHGAAAPVEVSVNAVQRASLPGHAAIRFDVLVIGGGIYGVMVAREAALRGLSVALIERSDWSSGTSYNSHKIVHGGIRYVQHLDVSRLRALARERAF